MKADWNFSLQFLQLLLQLVAKAEVTIAHPNNLPSLKSILYPSPVI